MGCFAFKKNQEKIIACHVSSLCGLDHSKGNDTAKPDIL
jgi:hypothetical protein